MQSSDHQLDSEAIRLQEEFKQACLRGEEPSIDEYLSHYDGPLFKTLLLDLIETELKLRCSSASTVDVETYASRFPELQDTIRERLKALLESRDALFPSTLATFDRDFVEPQSPQRGDPEDVAARHSDATVEFMSRTLGRYRLAAYLGRGAFGEVWQAYDPQLRRDVALKTPRGDVHLPPRTREEFIDEGHKAGRLAHPGIVRVYDAGEDEGRAYIVSELVPHGTLGDRMLCEPLSCEQSLRLIRDAAVALEYAHRRGVIHRDIKPGNILLGDELKPLLCDFGLAKIEQDESLGGAAGKIVGTPGYMSPEQAAGRGDEADARSDIYSLGVVLFELLTGRRPFAGKNRREVLGRIRSGEHRELKRADGSPIPDEAAQVCLRAMATRPEDRYATAAEFAEALTALLPESAPTIYGVGRRQALLWGVAGAAAAAAAAVGARRMFAIPGHRGGTPVRMSADLGEAELTFVPLQSRTGIPDPQRLVTVRSGALVLLTPGAYLVAITAGERFHEVYRTVPTDDAPLPGGPYRHMYYQRVDDHALLPDVDVPPADVTSGMRPHQGQRDYGLGARPGTQPTHLIDVPPYLVDPRKVDRAIYEGRFKRETLPPGFRSLPSERRRPYEQLGAPLTHVSWDWAMHVAERLGKRLLEEAEFEFAARQKMQPDQNGELSGWLQPPAVWTSSWAASFPVVGARLLASDGGRVVRGRLADAEDEISAQAILTDRHFFNRAQEPDNVGLWLARSLKPRCRPEDFGHTELR